jgi:hypothetical protein
MAFTILVSTPHQKGDQRLLDRRAAGALAAREELPFTLAALLSPKVGALSVLSVGPDLGVLPGHGLDVLGRGLEQLVGQVLQGAGDRDLVPDFGHGGAPGAAVALAVGGQVGR